MMAGINGSNNSLPDYPCLVPSCLFSTGGRFFIISSLFLLFFASLVGNILILVLLYKDRQLRARSSPSHISLAIADLLATVAWLPAMVFDLFIYEKWVFGSTVCKIFSFAQVVSIASSTLNLCIVTSECFAAVWFPFLLKVLPRKRTILISSCIIAWLVAFIDGVVYSHFKTLKVYDGEAFCQEEWPDETIRDIYIYANSGLIGFGPLIIITILNFLCIYRLCQSNTYMSTRRHSKKGSYTRSATKKILTISLVFVICRSPLHSLEIVMMSDDFATSIQPRDGVIYFTLCIAMYFLSAATHPILFGLLSVYYREAFVRNCPCGGSLPRRRKMSSLKTPQTTKILDTML